MNRRRFLTLSAAFACAPHIAIADVWRGQALGADVSVSLQGPKEAVQAALADIPAWLEDVETHFSLYRPDSRLSRLNRTGRLVAPGLFRGLLDQADRAHRLTNGLFDPTVQPLWDALAQGRDPEPARTLIGWDRVRHGFSGEIHLGPGQELTFNGIAQGYATDLIRGALRKRGFTQALVNIGEFAALGGPYRLGVSDPVFGLQGHVTLTESAVATSSPGALRLGDQGHILGPHGERPLWSTVTIEATEAAVADALSTAAVFMPLPRLRQLKSDARLRRLIVIDTEGNLRTI
ncbi:FAD:protein FMN transferase [Tropicibacter sp. S64]|uniref:FAD:protein FMN transferase n=1 Tax=Tropicibacter sp. S64 TaxID=3415122 RepID=UPI003C79ED58